MNKKFLLGTFVMMAAMILVSGIASAAITIVPAELDACCGVMQYTVIVTNEEKSQLQFDLAVDANRKLDIMLQPRQIEVPAKSSQDLVMLAKVPCGTLPGEYTITVSATSPTVCVGTCGDVCTIDSGSAEAVLRIGDDCAIPEEPAPEAIVIPEPPVEKENLTSEDNESAGDVAEGQSPTGAAVSEVDYSQYAIGILLVLLGVFLVLLALIQRNSEKKESEKGDSNKGDNNSKK